MAESQHPAQPPTPQSPLPPAPVLPSSAALSQSVPATPAGLTDPSLPPPIVEPAASLIGRTPTLREAAASLTAPVPMRPDPAEETAPTPPDAVGMQGIVAADAVRAPIAVRTAVHKVSGYVAGPFPGPAGALVPKTDGYAIAAFVSGLIGAVPVAPVLSIIALRRIRHSGDRGRSLAITGLVLTGCWLAVIGLIAALAVWGTREADVGSSTPVANIRVGQCFDADLGGSPLLVAKIADCAGPHAGEAYATASASLAGLDAKEKDLSAAQSCANSFAGFVGGPYDSSELDIFFVVLQDTEASGGNVLCMLGTPGRQLTGSMRGTGR